MSNLEQVSAPCGSVSVLAFDEDNISPSWCWKEDQMNWQMWKWFENNSVLSEHGEEELQSKLNLHPQGCVGAAFESVT